MKGAPRLTLAQAFVVANLSLAVLLALLFGGVSRGSRQSLLQTAELVQQTASTMIGQRLTAYFDGAERAIDAIERRFQLDLGDVGDPLSVEAQLFSAVLDDPDLAGVSLTHAEMLGFDEDGRMRLAPEGRWQLTAYRETPARDSAIFTARVRAEGPRYVIEERRRRAGEPLLGASFVRSGTPATDPTDALTFVTPASRAFYEQRHDLAASGRHRRAIWSDLTYVAQDLHLPAPQRRVVVTAQRAIEDGRGRFLGILRAGLRAEGVDRIVREEQERSAPNRIVLCDAAGRLVARLQPGDPLVEQPDEELRAEPRDVPEEIARALAAPVGPGGNPRRKRRDGSRLADVRSA